LQEAKRKECHFCVEKIDTIDFTDERKLRRYVTERGKIIPRRITGVCAKHQRILSRAIKKAREIAVLPYTSESHR
jgi:small subunit ribosomal protein S18